MAGSRREVLGLWIEQSEGAKFWVSVRDALTSSDLGIHPVLLEEVLPDCIGVTPS